NTWALESGAAIVEINARRARLSRIKGGKLMARLNGRPARALFISDVPGDDPAVIGSGLAGPLPVRRSEGESSAADNVRRTIVASIDQAVETAWEVAKSSGLNAHREPHRFGGEAERLAVRFTHELHMGSAQVRIWGGES